MTILEQPAPQATPIPGVAHATWAGQAQGLSQLSVWRQTLAPGAATPPHQHDCDEVVLCLAGEGELHLGADVRRFGADTSVVLPRGVVHQLFSVGNEPLELIGVFGSSPVGTALPDGQAIELPWAT
jgi:mannose-6-phosphate isomerase-like protein (cupin superfamily)